MIANSVELRVAMRNLGILEASLEALREEIETANPSLYEVSAKSYARRIAALQSEIAEYLHSHPSEISALLPREPAVVR
jgi:hypothetical protein